MPIPSFDQFGLLPHGIYDCTESEIIDRYCAANNNRLIIWDLFKEFIQQPQTFSWPNHIYIDGGFTSNKSVTKDIDVVIDISHLNDAEAFGALVWLSANKQSIMDAYKVDFWIKHGLIQNDLIDYFQYVKEEDALAKGMPTGSKKGLLRMSL